jgi:hypothetical protein
MPPQTRREDVSSTLPGPPARAALVEPPSLDLLRAGERSRDGFGAVRALRAPLPMCRSGVQSTFRHRETELGCLNPEFGELPAGSPTFRVFARVR